jgi:hypothetical protein
VDQRRPSRGLGRHELGEDARASPPRYSDENIRFDELCQLLNRPGFAERIRGGHHIFTRSGVEEILNLQPRGPLAKAYPVKQVRDVIVRHRLAGGQDGG